jgi:glycosyl transferase family 11
MTYVCMNIVGGLGNQLFMAALGVRLAHERNARLIFDASAYRSDHRRKYQLDDFSIDATTLSAPDKERLKLLPFRALNARYRRACEIASMRKRHYVTEKLWRFDEDILKLDVPVYLEGYWQTERYFSDVDGLIRQQFRLRKPIAERRSEVLASIGRAGASSVSLHVRRGDYVERAQSGGVFRLCSLEWYQRAMEKIAEIVVAPQFFVFSDDPGWARANLPEKWPRLFVDPGEDGKDFEDLHIMSNCGHHIIANSTFSWWGAWLNPSRNKTVIAPEAWFATPEIDTRDMIPSRWIRL